MKGLLVRVAADKTKIGGGWNGPVDGRTGEFVYVPICDERPCHRGLATPFSLVTPHLDGRWPSLPRRLAECNMHLDPDFSHLTYGDWRRRADQIRELDRGDLLVFYSGLRDVHGPPRLVYAIIGLYVIDEIMSARDVHNKDRHQNAHTRRRHQPHGDIVVRARPRVSGRLRRCVPIGEYRPPADRPDKRPAYRVQRRLLREWGGVSTDYLQRSARLPQLVNAGQFYRWFKRQRPVLVARNN